MHVGKTAHHLVDQEVAIVREEVRASATAPLAQPRQLHRRCSFLLQIALMAVSIAWQGVNIPSPPSLVKNLLSIRQLIPMLRHRMFYAGPHISLRQRSGSWSCGDRVGYQLWFEKTFSAFTWLSYKPSMASPLPPASLPPFQAHLASRLATRDMSVAGTAQLMGVELKDSSRSRSDSVGS